MNFDGGDDLTDDIGKYMYDCMDVYIEEDADELAGFSRVYPDSVEKLNTVPFEGAGTDPLPMLTLTLTP